MATLEEWAETATNEELKYELIKLNNSYLEFERFLIGELGKETYLDLCNEYAKSITNKAMREWGMNESEIAKFNSSFPNKERTKN